MKVLIRADASRQIGSGHVMRCLSLARELRARGANVVFACREHDGNLCDVIEADGFQVVRLALATFSLVGSASLPHARWLGVDWQTDADQVEAFLEEDGATWDALVVDHYALDMHWERRMRAHFKRVLVIDDLADRPHDCDWLLDQNYYPEAHDRYDGRIPADCERLLGPHFALLRPEFLEARRRLPVRTGVVRCLSICFGGVDPTNETSKTLQALGRLPGDALSVEVITGRHNPNLHEVQDLVARMSNASLVVDANDMAERFLRADLAFGAAGSTSWERACLGLPSIMLALALNQESVGESLAAAGAAFYLGPSAQVTEAMILVALQRALRQSRELSRMAERALELVDGRGTHRVATRLFEGRMT